MVDLHTHSTRSDGTYSPTALVDYAMEKGLSAFALTDHDCVDGLDEAIAYTESLKQSVNKTAEDTGKDSVVIPRVIPGIELSSEYQGKDVHILGLFIDYHNPAFQNYLKNFIESRNERNRKMCALLQEAGIDITYEKLLEEFPNSVITRAHYAKFFLKYGYTKSIKEGFERYVGDHCRYYVPREKVTPEQAIQLILEADGIPILAHPILYGLGTAHLDALVARLKSAGLIGIEAIYSTYTPADERQIRGLASKYHLFISGGSDFHGDNKPGLDLAVGYGRLYIPDEVLEHLERAHKNLLFSDMDGTLLHSDNTVSPAMKEALDQMTAMGHRLILSSGRPLMSILEVAEQAGLNYPGTMIIANNGALIYDYEKRQPVIEYKLTREQISYLVAAADENHIHIHGYTDTHIVCRQLNEELTYYTKRIHMPLQFTNDMAKTLSAGSYKLQCISLTNHAALIAFRDKMLSHFGDDIQMIFSNENYLEILPKEAGKGKAIGYITDFLSMPHRHTFAAGDAENDITMLQAAAYGIAMQNADAMVKAAADIITEADNNHDGLLEVIQKYFL